MAKDLLLYILIGIVVGHVAGVFARSMPHPLSATERCMFNAYSLPPGEEMSRKIVKCLYIEE